MLGFKSTIFNNIRNYIKPQITQIKFNRCNWREIGITRIQSVKSVAIFLESETLMVF